MNSMVEHNCLHVEHSHLVLQYHFYEQQGCKIGDVPDFGIYGLTGGCLFTFDGGGAGGAFC